MCAPAVAPIVQGAGQVAGIMGQQQAGQAQADAQNDALKRQYEHQIMAREQEWRNDLNIWEQRNNEYDAGVFADTQRVWNAYEQNQEALNQKATEAAFSNETAAVKMIEATGKFAGGMDNRRSYERAAMSAFGRDQASTARMLTDATFMSKTQNEKAQLAYQDSLNSRYSKVSIAPQPGMAPMQPTMVKGPETDWGGILGAVGSTIGGLNAAKAPAGYTGNRAGLGINAGYSVATPTPLINNMDAIGNLNALF